MFRVNENRVVLRDSLMSTQIDNKFHTFYDIKLEQSSSGITYSQVNQEIKEINNQSNTIYESSFDDLFQVMIFVDDEIFLIERTVLNVIDAFSNTGGQIGLLFPVIKLFLHSIQKTQYISSILKRIFYYNDSFDPNKKKRRKSQNSHQKQSSYDFSKAKIGNFNDTSKIHLNNNSMVEASQTDISFETTSTYSQNVVVFLNNNQQRKRDYIKMLTGNYKENLKQPEC
eukprot:403338508